jgi:hypothetical protein
MGNEPLLRDYEERKDEVGRYFLSCRYLASIQFDMRSVDWPILHWIDAKLISMVTGLVKSIQCDMRSVDWSILLDRYKERGLIRRSCIHSSCVCFFAFVASNILVLPWLNFWECYVSEKCGNYCLIMVKTIVISGAYVMLTQTEHFEIVTSCMTCSQCIEQLENQLFIVKILIRLSATFSGFAIFALSRICVSWLCLNDFKYSWLGWVLLPCCCEIFWVVRGFLW